MAVPAGVPEAIGVVDDASHRRGDSLEAAMGMLREPGDAVAVVHAVRRVGVEVRAVAAARRAHLLVPGGVLVVVVHREQERVGGLERELQPAHLADDGRAAHRARGRLGSGPRGAEVREARGGAGRGTREGGRAETGVGQETRETQRAHVTVAHRRQIRVEVTLGN